MKDWLRRNWKRIAVFVLAALAAGFLAIGQPEVAAAINALRAALGI